LPPRLTLALAIVTCLLPSPSHLCFGRIYPGMPPPSAISGVVTLLFNSYAMMEDLQSKKKGGNPMRHRVSCDFTSKLVKFSSPESPLCMFKSIYTSHPSWVPPHMHLIDYVRSCASHTTPMPTVGVATIYSERYSRAKGDIQRYSVTWTKGRDVDERILCPPNCAGRLYGYHHVLHHGNVVSGKIACHAFLNSNFFFAYSRDIWKTK
jgi:hypothetical protein